MRVKRRCPGVSAVKIATPRFLFTVACLFALAGMLAPFPNASAALAPYRSAVLADGAVAYYEFDETSGTTATDSAGGDNNGTYLGGYLLGESAGGVGLGSAVNFNGSDARVRIPDSATFDFGTGAFSRTCTSRRRWSTPSSYVAALPRS